MIRRAFRRFLPPRSRYRLRSRLADIREVGTSTPQSSNGPADRRLLFVCRGNICRSPLAEALLRRELFEQGVVDVEVDSAGITGVNSGLQPHWLARRVARAHGLSLRGMRARVLEPEDLDRFDSVVVFDNQLRNELARFRASRSSRAQVLGPDDWLDGAEVADPIGAGRAAFEDAFEKIQAGCIRLAADLADGGREK